MVEEEADGGGSKRGRGREPAALQLSRESECGKTSPLQRKDFSAALGCNKCHVTFVFKCIHWDQLYICHLMFNTECGQFNTGQWRAMHRSNGI